MSQQTMPPCTAGLTSADLSAWRDDMLSGDEAAHIGAHSAGCPACQERLRGFEMIAASLHTQQSPMPDGRLWQSVIAAISASELRANGPNITDEVAIPDQSSGAMPIPPASPAHHSWRRRALGTLAAVAAIALVVVGFGQLFRSGASTRQTQSFPVKWRQATLPGGLGANLGAGASLSVFPADGSIAWICQSGTQGSPGELRIWRTSDGGATWRSVQVPQLTHAFNCQVHLDQLEPNVAVLDLMAYVHPDLNQSQATAAVFDTFDGGAHWQDAPYILPMTEFATLNGSIYALRQDGTDANRIEVSRDGAKTWNYIDESLHEQKLIPSQFWLNPATGGLLVQAISLIDNGITSLWTAATKGGHWKQVAAPSLGAVVAKPTADGQHWNICSLVAGTGSDRQHLDYTSHTYCATEQSNTWPRGPGLDFPRWGNATPTSCAGCVSVPNDDPYGAITPLGIANDGALLAIAEDRFDARGQATRTSLYRLPMGSATWQNGGALPGPAALYTPRPGGGMLWSMPLASGIGNTTGPVFTASYPGMDAPPLPKQMLQTPMPTGNVDQGAPLEWQPITNPGGFQPRQVNTNILAVAPSDGSTAYACSQPNLNSPATQLRAWVTHNAGATWSALTLPRVAGWCSLMVDEVNPRDVLLGISQNPPGTIPDTYYRSSDGGVTWQHVSGLDGSRIYQFATRGATTYALRTTMPLSPKAPAQLQASSDGMATWHAIESDIRSTGMSVSQFWLNPYNGVLLATNSGTIAVGAPSNTQPTLLIWRSGDGGAHWRNLQMPQSGYTTVLVQPPQPNHTWSVCVAGSNVVVCSDDSGQTGQNIPAPNTGGATATLLYTAYTSDGALLAISTASDSNGAATYNVLWLPSGANRWQSLGPTPEFSLLYAPALGGNGMLWSVPINGVLTDPQGRIFRVAAP